jgi:GNAT superfamily N-acetyltransferase
MKWELHRAGDLTAGQRSALQVLSVAVYPPEVSAEWPGRVIEWTPAQWALVGWEDDVALCHAGVVLREALLNGGPVKAGGIGGVKTHPDVRGRGFATTAMRLALDFFREQGDVDFGLLVCEPALVPVYERLGWHRFPGELLVRQRGATVPFTLNLPMTTPVRLSGPLAGNIDLQGPPW